jgi:hypothetical protein
MSIWTSASDELQQYMAQREVERRQQLLDEIYRARAKREQTEFEDTRTERARKLKEAETEKAREQTRQQLDAMRQASLNVTGRSVDLPTGQQAFGGGEATQRVGDPMGAQATRDTLNVALRLAGGGAQADVDANSDVARAKDAEKKQAIEAYLQHPTDAGRRALEARYNVKLAGPEYREVDKQLFSVEDNKATRLYPEPGVEVDRPEDWTTLYKTLPSGERTPYEYNRRTHEVRVPKLPGDEDAGPTMPKLAQGQQDAMATMKTIEDLGAKAIALGDRINWDGVGGMMQGTMMQQAKKQFGWGSDEAESLRNYISNVRGTIAKLRGGTAFTANEEKLLDAYTPTIDDDPSVIKTKISSLNEFIKILRRNTISAARTGRPLTPDERGEVSETDIVQAIEPALKPVPGSGAVGGRGAGPGRTPLRPPPTAPPRAPSTLGPVLSGPGWDK